MVSVWRLSDANVPTFADAVTHILTGAAPATP
jgi:hypothetical protein